MADQLPSQILNVTPVRGLCWPALVPLVEKCCEKGVDEGALLALALEAVALLY